MKVAQVNISDLRGGAAIAASRLHFGLRQSGVDSQMFVAEKFGQDKNTFILKKDWVGYFERRLKYRQLTYRFWRYAMTRPIGLSPFTHAKTTRNRGLIQNLPNVDLINLHWIANFIDLPNFLSKAKVPVVWTLHDMNAFTGGCHYALDCRKYLLDCGACPQLGSMRLDDPSKKIWQIKRDVYKSLPLDQFHIVCPSSWLANLAAKSSLLQEKQINVIPNGLDTQLFKPHIKKTARIKLGLPPNKKIVLFSAANIHSKRKGLDILLSALEGFVLNADWVLVSIGDGSIEKRLPFPVISLGYLADAYQLALAYSSADLFIMPSQQDNFPNTILESIACGTPVIAFNVGGIPDIVRPGITGQLIPAGDKNELIQAMTALLKNDQKRINMGVQCREIAEREYQSSVQAERYIQLYERIINNKNSNEN